VIVTTHGVVWNEDRLRLMQSSNSKHLLKTPNGYKEDRQKITHTHSLNINIYIDRQGQNEYRQTKYTHESNITR